MSSVGPDRLRPAPRPDEDWRGYNAPRGNGPPWGLIVAGLVVAGLGAWAWQTLGPDVRRYIKISKM